MKKEETTDGFCHFDNSALKYTTLFITKSFQGVSLLVLVAVKRRVYNAYTHGRVYLFIS